MIIETRSRSNPKYLKTYRLWRSMMDRCYNKRNGNYKYYGAKGVFVSDRWLSLDNFIEDVDKIDGFDMYAYLNGGIALDKDKKIYLNKEYSLSKCSFITLEENNKHKPNQQRLVIGEDAFGAIHEFYNQSEFARENGLRQSSIGDCLGGKCKTHKGWKFRYKKPK